MKRLVALLMVFILTASCIVAEKPRLDLRDMALAGATSADSSYVYSGYTNPAMLWYVDKLYGNISLKNELYSSDGSFSNPLLALDGMLVMKGLLISLDIGTKAQPVLNGDILSRRTTTLSVGLSAGVGNFSAGFLISGGGDSQHIIDAADTGNFFSMLSGMFFSRYDSVPSSEFLDTKLGLAYSGKWLSVSAYSDDIFNYRASEEQKSESVGQVLERIGLNSSFSLAFRTPEYDDSDLLNLFRGMVFFEAYHPFDDDTREYRASGEFTLNFLPQVKLSLRTGFGFPAATDKDNYNTLGLGFEFYWLRIDVASKIPFEVYRTGKTDGMELAFMFTAVL